MSLHLSTLASCRFNLQGIEAQCLNQTPTMNTVSQICYNEEQRNACVFPALFNTDCTEFFENSIIVESVRQSAHVDSKWFGVLSWRLRQKLSLVALPNMIPPRLRWLAHRMMDPELRKRVPLPLYCSLKGVDIPTEFDRRIQLVHDDVGAFSIIAFGPVNLMRQANRVHPGFEPHFRKMADAIGIHTIHSEYEFPMFFNYWLMRSEVAEQYVNEALVPAMDYLITVKELYAGTRYRFMKLPTHLRGKWGSDYFPMHPFLLERLPTVWLKHRGIVTSTLGF